MNKEQYPNKDFFDNVGLISTIDSVAQRYHVLPTDVLNLSLFDFSLNVAIMLKALTEEVKMREEVQKKHDQKKKGNSFLTGFDRKIG
jgi:hypothetical protein